MKRWRLLLALGLVLALVSPVPAAALPAVEGPGVQLLESDEQGIVLELETPDYRLEEEVVKGAACQGIYVPGYPQSGGAGQPQLPLQIVLLGVPPEADVELEVSPLKTARLSTPAPICPAPEAVTEEGEQGLVRRVTRGADPDPAIYDRNAFYPSQLARVEELGFQRSQRIVRLEISPFQVNPLSGEMLHHRHLRLHLRFKGGTGATSAVAEPEEFETALRSVLLNYEAARAWRGQPAQSAPEAAWNPPDPGYKVLVDEDGIYELSRAALAQAGLPVASLDPRTFQLFSSGQEVAIQVSGEGDGRFDEGDSLLFYGQAADTRYTGTNVYWLTYGAAAGLRMEAKASQNGGASAASYSSYLHLEENRAYVSSLPMEAGHDHWYGPRIQAAGVGNPGSRDFKFSLEHLSEGAHSATLEVVLAGNVVGTHHLRLYVNGQQVQDASWQGRTVYQATAEYPQSYLSDGENVIRIELANDTADQFVDMVYTDWLRVGYQRAYTAQGDRLAFGGDEPGTWRYRVDGFGDEAVEVYDVTDPSRVSRITGTTVTAGSNLVFLPLVIRGRGTVEASRMEASRMEASILEATAPVSSGPGGRGMEATGGYTLEFGDTHSGGRRYQALTRAERLTPVSIKRDAPSDLQSSSKGADYLIVTHGNFQQSLQLLASLRSAQGKRVQVVDVQDAYDEFGYGLMSAEAIRDFLAYTYHNWQAPAPSYVLLVGDGTYDYRHYLATSTPTYIPPYLEFVDPDLGEAATDNRYACVSGSDFLPDLNIGRLPANTPAEAETLVHKIVSYEMIPAAGDWNRNVVFVADDLEGGGGNFYSLSDRIADGYVDPPTNTIKLLPEAYSATKVYLGQTCPKENPSEVCKQEIVDTLNTSGALLLSYAGHGTKTYWAEERLMDLAALDELANGDKLPITLSMTCLEGYFHEADGDAFAEANVRRAGGGSVASWSATGLGLATGHDLLERGLFLALFHDGVRELGAATTQGKLYLLANSAPGQYDDLIDTYLVLGDPALRVQLVAP